jgi:hypothetical protein
MLTLLDLRCVHARVKSASSHARPASIVNGGAVKVRFVGRCRTDIANLHEGDEELGDIEHRKTF